MISRGIPGQTTAEIDERVETELNNYHPDAVVLFAGMNDAVNDRNFSRLSLRVPILKVWFTNAGSAVHE